MSSSVATVKKDVKSAAVSSDGQQLDGVDCRSRQRPQEQVGQRLFLDLVANDAARTKQRGQRGQGMGNQVEKEREFEDLGGGRTAGRQGRCQVDDHRQGARQHEQQRQDHQPPAADLLPQGQHQQRGQARKLGNRERPTASWAATLTPWFGSVAWLARLLKRARRAKATLHHLLTRYLNTASRLLSSE